ncbi:MAG: hypothetical protein P4L74_02230 [Candidatus Doudnabacteria bacterium]|nr:hypothetical protein [Candidatus Doudnabacteria bacterium]
MTETDKEYIHQEVTLNMLRSFLLTTITKSEIIADKKYRQDPAYSIVVKNFKAKWEKKFEALNSAGPDELQAAWTDLVSEAAIIVPTGEY